MDDRSDAAVSPPRPASGADWPRWTAWWDPRRSLGARLLWILVPSLLLTATVYRILSNRLWEESERKLTDLLLEDAARVARITLRQSAERRVRQLNERGGEVVGVLREAASLAASALEAGPAPGAAEALVSLPNGVFLTEPSGASSALVVRGAGLTPVTRRDLGSTRRLEPGFSALVAGHSQISTTFALTVGGVLRAVPARDVARLAAETPESGFRFPDRWNGLPPSREPAVFWSSAYEDVYAGRGRIVTALAPVFSRDGKVVAEVGVDWAFGDLFTRVPDVGRSGESELVFDAEGHMVLRLPARGQTTAWSRALSSASPEREQLLSLVSGHDEVERDGTLGGESVILVARRLPPMGWTYLRLLPRSSLKDAVLAQITPVFETNRAQRLRVQNGFLLMIVLVGGALVTVSRRAVAPIRRIARYADALTGGSPGGEPDGVRRSDEIGRLARAMRDMGRRIRRRIQTMEGLHDVARTASMMTRPDETYARLSRRIAQLVGATKAWIALWDPETRALAFTPPGYGVADERLRGVRIPLSEKAIAIQAFRTGETAVSNDLLTDPRVSKEIARAVDVRENAIFVPLKTEVGTVGVLIVCDKPGGFDQDDEAAVQGYADQAALLLRNARLYEELQRSYERLQEAQRNRDYFLQNINHELRTPLTAILGWSEVLADDRPEPPTVTTAVEQIRRSAQFLLTLISDLLDLSRVEEGAMRIQPVPTDLGTLLAEAVEPVAVMAEAKGITIAASAPPRGAETARLDPVRLKQVLWNLVHNAVKFTPPKGRIDVAVHREEGGGVLFRVADDGVGVDPKDLPYIFDRFRQGDGSTTRAYRGTGIGLALAKAIVELHGGTIAVASEPGSGAVFTIRIPDAVAVDRSDPAMKPVTAA